MHYIESYGVIHRCAGYSLAHELALGKMAVLISK